MPSVGDIPLEIWVEVLDRACLDDGTTARSLSLVSKRINESSRSHLYYSVKIDTIEHLVKLDKQISKQQEGYRPLGTRFLSIALPKSLKKGVFPEESYNPDGDSQDEGYKPSLSSNVTGTLSFFGEDESSASGPEDILNHPDHTIVACQPLLKLSDLANCPNALGQSDYRVYGAMRRLLEACAHTLEIFSLYFKPYRMIPHDILFPSLPRLRHLSIYLSNTNGYTNLNMSRASDSGDLQGMFPSLKMLRMLGHVASVRWWTDIISSRPLNTIMKLVTQRVFYRNLDPSIIPKLRCNWYFLDTRVCHEMQELSVQWWLDDVNGRSGISAEYLESDYTDDEL